MKTTKISKYAYNKYKDFPRTKKTPQKNDIWLALFPYETLGNMQKIRPVLIENVTDDYVIARMITTNSNKGVELDIVQNHLYKKSYLTNCRKRLTYDKLYGKIKSNANIKEE